MVEPIFDYQFRLILIGNSTVGKSSLLKYFTDGKFAEVSDPTVGVDFFARLVEVKSGARIKLQLWDTAVGALLVYDICSRSSFESIPQWMNEAKRHIDPHTPVFALVGCKLDLAKSGPDTREVSEEEAKAFSQRHGIFHIETSAKTGHNVDLAFKAVTQEVYDRIESGEYKVEEGWDGIKTGYARPSNLDYNILEADSARASCC